MTFLLLKIKLTINILYFPPQDYWFFKQLDVSPLKTKNMTVHLMKVHIIFFELLLNFWYIFRLLMTMLLYNAKYIVLHATPLPISVRLYIQFNLFTYYISANDNCQFLAPTAG
jgi:hypothetical protein